MSFEIDATYEDGKLLPERDLPLTNGQKVRLSIHSPGGRARGSYGLLAWTGDASALDYLMGPESHPWAAE
jgi:hypothetical protein